MKKIILFISAIILFSCSKDDEINHSELKIRLLNVSQYDFQNIMVNNTNRNISFGNLMSGQKSEYKEFDKAYYYDIIELEIDGKTYTFQPKDYVLDAYLEDGNYTYQLDVSDADERYGKLSVMLIKD